MPIISSHLEAATLPFKKGRLVVILSIVNISPFFIFVLATIDLLAFAKLISDSVYFSFFHPKDNSVKRIFLTISFNSLGSIAKG